MGMNSAPQKWDPATWTINDEAIAGQALFSNLTYFDALLRPHPDLAESWSSTPDLLTWTFKLRENVRFHHGKRLTPDDVIYSLKRVLNPKVGSPGQGIISYIKRMSKKGSNSVVFQLSSPSADLPADLAYVYMRIIPSDLTPEQLQKTPSGTGPFMLKNWIPGEQVVFERNPQYFMRGLPYLDGWTMLTIPEETTRVAALTRGSVDALWTLSPQAALGLKGNSSVNILVSAPGNFQPLVMKSDVKPFSDVRVRKAFKTVLDRKAFSRVVTLGFGAAGNDQPIPKFQLPQLGRALPPPARDIDRAKALLAQAGYPDGIDVTLYASPGRVGMVESATAYQQMAAPAGIRIKVEKIPIDTYWSDIWLKQPLMVSNWATAPTINIRLQQTFLSSSPNNESFVKSPALDRLIAAGRAEPNPRKRAAIYVRAAKLISSEGGEIIGYLSPFITAARRNVHAYRATPLTVPDLRATWMDA
jgi:peptide/nickel transport system substrate-binding protein